MSVPTAAGTIADLAADLLDDLAADRQSHTRAAGAASRASSRSKMPNTLLTIRLRDPYAIIRDRDFRSPVVVGPWPRPGPGPRRGGRAGPRSRAGW